MTARTAGLATAAAGLAVAAWAWLGWWPWSAPAAYSGSDFTAINTWGLAVAMLGCLIAIVGVLFAFAGRGGPDGWAGGRG